MYTLFGASALSPFRQQSLLQSLSGVTHIDAQFVHFVAGFDSGDTAAEAILRSLLDYGQQGQQADINAIAHNASFVVVPRLGTISPWSSKATHIALNTGITLDRIERGIVYALSGDFDTDTIVPQLYDRMVETVMPDVASCAALFDREPPKPAHHIPVLEHGEAALVRANNQWGLALSAQEITYLVGAYQKLNRNPTDAEIYMFAQANSEHCRHKIFNAGWDIDGKKQNVSLLSMIKNTTNCTPEGVLSAYKDNASVIMGCTAERFFPVNSNGVHIYQGQTERIDILMKVETHNHPTAIAPYSGSATGIGGEIRDEGATGKGAKPKAGLSGFCVSNLHIPSLPQAWESGDGIDKPAHITSALKIMIDAPVGGADFANEFGRPQICGYFRTYEQQVGDRGVFGYHKPIMIAGGMGNIRPTHIDKGNIATGENLICLGGAAMRIGLGGGAASSTVSGSGDNDLDFASVQRGNPEMQRRCQEVIDRCWQMGEDNPISFIHDVGAGGISNAFPELVKDGGVGGRFELRHVLSGDNGMSPLEIWSNESQERYVLSIPADKMAVFDRICVRERCPYAVVGQAVSTKHITVTDAHFGNTPVDMPMDILFGNTPRMHRTVTTKTYTHTDINPHVIPHIVSVSDAINRVLRLPAVASKSFLITIGDRSISGMVARDQMVGKWQVPVADCAVTTATLSTTQGEAMAMGERTPIAIIDAAASGRMAVGEAITNLAGACIGDIKNIRLSANWMCACGHDSQDQALFETVKAVAMDFCPALGVAIPVGKDSLSMRTTWTDNGVEKSVTSPLSLIISAFTPVKDTVKTVTPDVHNDPDTTIIAIDLGNGNNRMGGSALCQVYNSIGSTAPDITAPVLKAFFEITQRYVSYGTLLAYHDRSDGGICTTLFEMAFAGRVGVNITIPTATDPIAYLFNEELGACIQVHNSCVDAVLSAYQSTGIDTYAIATIGTDDTVVIRQGDTVLYSEQRAVLQQKWAETSYHMQRLRDNADCADAEFNRIVDTADPGLSVHSTFDVKQDITAPFVHTQKPKIAILREQGVNGQVEMAHAFTVANWQAIDVHMSDLHARHIDLNDFKGLVACGGFSYGDVLGAGGGWAKNILHTPHLKQAFTTFFQRSDTVALGVCNGCQMMAHLKSLIPQAQQFPIFVKNMSEQFESRVCMVEIQTTDSIWFDGMAGTRAPVPVAHGEGRPVFENHTHLKTVIDSHQISMCYIDNYGTITEQYPQNPNGAVGGIAGLTANDGRVQIMMPHPERAYRTATQSWYPQNRQTKSPYSVWIQMFRNARKYIG